MIGKVHNVHGRTWRALALCGALVALGACGDDDNNLVVVGPGGTPDGVVTTLKDSAFDFTVLHTFAMPDTIMHLVPATGTPLAVTGQFDRATLDKVRASFLARGYTQVTPSSTVIPDFIVLVGATATTNYNAWVGYPFFAVWGSSPVWVFNPSFDNSWTIVYPWAAVVGVTAFDRGTLLIDLIPTKTVTPVTKSVRSAWSGVATGELNGSFGQGTINAAVDEMFRQSPYLVSGPTVNPLNQR
ncbi:MAG TPA: DUF4136 domain-containing protein [Gemmatimonadaceae bacterium]|nr:DUF4136 domain-containing protein [Gemmatimonadaceae bacterium]